MVRVKEVTFKNPEGNVDIELWLASLANKKRHYDIGLLRQACMLVMIASQEHATEVGVSCLELGLAMADVLSDLEVDQDTVLAGLIFESVHYAELSIEDIEEDINPQVAKLIKGIAKMDAIASIQSRHFGMRQHIDNVRKMLLAMVDDVRVVLIKLVQCLCILRLAHILPAAMREQLAMEAMDIYAPLANRLGVGVIKWELEDLAFRYLQPEAYKSIARGLKLKRLERDNDVKEIVHTLNEAIADLHIEHVKVYGRAKHIHSIYRKMMRKHVPLSEIYDAIAVRVLVDTKEQCYAVLGLVHALWKPVPEEFDDYITHPKKNGYQSLHTAVENAEGRVFEVQIRTFDMHSLAEKGVAAHWKYKEGGAAAKTSHERKIEWLRDVLAWHKEMTNAQGGGLGIEPEFVEDRIYVFTPEGEVLDLPVGVTPLDFAYYIHSHVGHCCRGAKVNGNMVPLTYVLQTGDNVEILTGKHEKPSRDWLNAHLGYLNTARARSKVAHWFKVQDYDNHKVEGRALLERELKAMHMTLDAISPLLSALHFKRLEDLYAAVGRGDVKVAQVTSRLLPQAAAPEIKVPEYIAATTSTQGLSIAGVGNLLTYMARCCHPMPGDSVVGYITVGRGVSIHKRDCANVLRATEKQKERFLDVHWGEGSPTRRRIYIRVTAMNEPRLVKAVTHCVSLAKYPILSLQTEVQKKDNTLDILLSVEIEDTAHIQQLIHALEGLPNILVVRRE